MEVPSYRVGRWGHQSRRRLFQSRMTTHRARDFAMAWTDKNGNRWLFGGSGFEVTHDNTDGIPGLLNDMWVWPTTPSSGLDDGWWLPGGWIPANLPLVQ